MKLNINIGNEHLLKHFPNFEYFNCTEPERLNFNKIDNLVGDQQRTFVLYHILKEVKRNGEIGVSLGCGQIIEPFCIGIDHYYGPKHPIYGGGYWPQLAIRCDKLPFSDNTIAFIVGSHIFEHMENPVDVVKEWIRVLKPNGAMILIIPDANYESQIQPWDFDHKMFYTPEMFQAIVLDPCEKLIKTEEFNSFKNSFSINYVGRKI